MKCKRIDNGIKVISENPNEANDLIDIFIDNPRISLELSRDKSTGQTVLRFGWF
jgi:hypothetical protein